MAGEREIKIVISAQDDYSAALKKFNTAMNEGAGGAISIAQQLEKVWNNSIESFKKQIMGAAAAYYSVGFLLDARRDALEAEASFNKLRMQVENLGRSWKQEGSIVDSAIQKASDYARVQDDEVAKTLQTLIFNSGKYQESITNLNLVYDLSYQKGIDVSEAAMLIGKAMTGNVDMLGRYIPELHNVDRVLGANATSQQKSAYALALLGEKTQLAMEKMTEHEKRARESAKAMQDFKEAVGGVILRVQDYAIGALDSMAAAILYGYGAWEKLLAAFSDAKAWISGNAAAKAAADEHRRNAAAALAAADALGIQAGVLLGHTTILNENTEAKNKNAKGSKDLAANIRAENDAILSRQLSVQKDMILLRAREAVAKRTAALETQDLEANFISKTMFAEEYFYRKTDIETRSYLASRDIIKKQTTDEMELAAQRIAELERQKDTKDVKAEEDKVRLDLFTKLNDLEQKAADLDNQYTIGAIKNLKELRDAQTAQLNERVAALAVLEDLNRRENNPYAFHKGEGGAAADIYLEYQNKMEALQDYNAKVLQAKIDAGATQLEVEAEYQRLTTQMHRAEYQMRLGAAANFAGGMANFFQNLFIAGGKHNRALFEMGKAFAIAEAVMNTAKAATKALDAPPGPPWSFAYVAATIAAGAAQIATITSTQPGGGAISSAGTAAPSYSGGSPSAYPIPQTIAAPLQDSVQPTQNVTLIIQNPLNGQIADSVAENIIELLNRNAGNNYKLDARIVQA